MIYLDTFSQIYRTISVYASHNGMTLNEYIEELGFKRTMLRPFVHRTNDEEDMEIYQPVEDANSQKRFLQIIHCLEIMFSLKNLRAINSNAKNMLIKWLVIQAYLNRQML